MPSDPFTIQGGQMPDLYLVYDHYELLFLKKWAPDPQGGQNSAHAWDGIDTYDFTSEDLRKPMCLTIGEFRGEHGEAHFFATRKEAEDACNLLTKEWLAHGTPADEIDFRVLTVHPKVSIEYTTEPVTLCEN